MIILLDFDLTLTKVSVTKAHLLLPVERLFKSYVRQCMRQFVAYQQSIGNAVVILSFNHHAIVESALRRIGVDPSDVVVATPELLEGKSGFEAHREANSPVASSQPLLNLKVRFVERLVETGLPKNLFLFFDDNKQNISAMSQVGVQSFLVPVSESLSDPVYKLMCSAARQQRTPPAKTFGASAFVLPSIAISGAVSL